MRIARQDELADPQRVVFGDPIGDLGMASDQRRAGSAPQQTDAGPQVGVDLEPVAPAAVQVDHPPLADRGGAGQRALRGGDRLLVGVGDQRFGGRPRLFGVIAGDDVQADAEAQFAFVGLGERAHPVQVLAT